MKPSTHRFPILLTLGCSVILIMLIISARIPATPAMHPASQLSPTEYAKGSVREKDAIQRTSPHLIRELSQQQLKLGAPVFLRIFKESRELEVWVLDQSRQKFKLFKTWPIAAMSGKLGPKTAEGDLQAPEGFYYVKRSAMKPDSSFHLAFNLGYPNSYDRAHDYTGGFLMVHGNRVSIGCYAMTDPGIEEIYTLCASALQKGQGFFRVHCFPFRMSDERMKAASQNKHYPFWLNLKEGYDWFEKAKTPPDVSVKNKRYHFAPLPTAAKP